jgi:hypothetical protein
VSVPRQDDRKLFQRLGRNLGCYCGQTIEIEPVLHEIETVARNTGWQVEVFLDDPPQRLFALSRRLPGESPSVYVSSGIHGDEPAGPLAILELLRDSAWCERASTWIVPCLNPAGFTCNRRENPQGVDLNRDYLNPRTPEILAHVQWLDRQPEFDLTLCLHEDWESNGFYVYELNSSPHPSLAPRIVEAVAEVCPVDYAEVIEGRPARGGIIRPTDDATARRDWPEAFYLTTHKTRLSYTLEAPSDFDLSIRIAALVEGTRAACAAFTGC